MNMIRIGIAIALLIVAGLLGFMAYRQVAPPAGRPDAVIIPEHCSRAEASRLLVAAGVISSRPVFDFLAERRALEPRPGRYVFLTGVYPWTAVRMLARGVPEDPQIAVTFPEGWRLEEFAARLEANGVVSAEDFLARAQDPQYAARLLGHPAPSLEGYLFPDSYRFKPHTPADEVIARLHGRFNEIAAAIEHVNLDTHAWVTLASIVEKEAKRDEERSVIAAVFVNRLRRGMRLEADPTVRYALGRWDTAPVLYSDLENPSPYNTYRHFGLPPGPIASPGRASLAAAANPASTSALFFVARGDGSHVFSETLNEHIDNIHAIRGGRP